MSLPNVLIYCLFAAYLWGAWHLYRTRSQRKDAYPVFLLGLVPAFLLTMLGMTVGAEPLPKKRLVIHGYRIALPEKGIYVGSDGIADQIRINHRVKGREWFSPGLVRLQPLADGSLQLTQTDPFSPNMIVFDGRPLRALPLDRQGKHRLTFGALGHEESQDKSITLHIDGNRPVFEFRGKSYLQGFVREGLGGWIYKPYGDGVLRHLAVGQRLPLAGLPVSASELLKQAAVFRYRGQWWLAANDADMRLDGQAFPMTAKIKSGTWISLVSRQLGGGRKTYKFQVSTANKPDLHAFFAFEQDQRPVFPLNDDRDALNQRLCLTATESHFSNTNDILNPQFPAGGVVIHREGGGFVFRGEIMAPDTLYSAGKAVFSLDQQHPERLRAMAFFAVLFLLTVFLVPPGLVRREPFIGIVLSGATFLLAFRQILAFRAWQGPPFKTSVLFDSLTAPYIFMLLILALTTRFEPLAMFRRVFGTIHNFFRPRNRKPLGQARNRHGSTYLLGCAVFGLLIYSLLPQKLGIQFPGLILGCLLLAFVVNMFGYLEGHLSMHAAGAPGWQRWRPFAVFLGFFTLLILLAPMFGSREVIAMLPGRPRPDIFIQIFLIFTAAYFASIWEREAALRVPRPWVILLTFLATVTIPLFQGIVSHDMGFFLMAAPPVVFVLILATWHLDARLRVLLGMMAFGIVAGIWFIKAAIINLDQLPMRRVAFFIDPQRLKAEYFFEYLAHLPILWVGDQGLFGGGFFTGDWYPALSETSVNDNVASVFIQGELGGLGTLFTMSVFLVMAFAMIAFLAEKRQVRGFRVWFLLAVVLTMVWTSATMFLANLGVFPLTGKNLPFLGIDSLNDVVRYGLLFGFGIRYMDATRED